MLVGRDVSGAKQLDTDGAAVYPVSYLCSIWHRVAGGGLSVDGSTGL